MQVQCDTKIPKLKIKYTKNNFGFFRVLDLIQPNKFNDLNFLYDVWFGRDADYSNTQTTPINSNTYIAI